MRTLQQMAREAIQVQDACNPLGLSKGYAAMLTELRARLAADGQPAGTRDLCDHPVNRLWASKLHDLAGMGMSDTERYGQAYDACKALAEGGAATAGRAVRSS